MAYEAVIAARREAEAKMTDQRREGIALGLQMSGERKARKAEKLVAANDNVSTKEPMRSTYGNPSSIGFDDWPHTNDNQPQDESGQSAGFGFHDGGYVGLAGGLPAPIVATDYVIPRAQYEKIIERGLYHGLRRHPVERVGDFMQTFSGQKYWPMEPHASEVHIEDIAHSLSLQCRYAGHCILFYSVAEHSVHIARWLRQHYGPLTALYGLLHDATEAYCVDVPRPLKPFLSNYKDVEAKNWTAIAERFGLSAGMPDAVHEADNRIIADELVNLKPMAWHARYDDPLGVGIGCWSPRVAEEEFLAEFATLDRLTKEARA